MLRKVYELTPTDFRVYSSLSLILITLNVYQTTKFYTCFICRRQFNSLPNDKISDESKFKAFADDEIITTQKLKFKFGRVENIVGKGENAGC